MNRDEIGAGKQRLDICRLFNLCRQLPGALNGNFWIEPYHFHAQGLGRIGHLHADGTETDTDLVVDTDAASFTLTINAGEFVGEGQFTEGDAWAWTAWTSTSTGTDGTRVVSTDTVTATGISASKEGFNTDGELEWTLDEELTTISQAEYQAALDALPK